MHHPFPPAASLRGLPVAPCRSLLLLLLLLPLLLPFRAAAQNTDGDWLFGSNTLHTVELTFDDPNYWDSLTTNYDLGANVAAHMTVDNVAYQIVGVQFKGNSSYNGPSDKKSFKIDVNAYYTGQRIDGEKKFNLNNCFKDPSFLREKLFLDHLNAIGAAAPRCTYAKLYLNGSYWGLYTLVEGVDKTFLDNRFNDDTGNLFKGDPTGDLRWYGTDQASYYTHYELHTNETQNDWSDLVHAVDVINNTPDADLTDSIHARFKTQKMLRAWAANNLFVNLDSYLGSGHNYYLYHDSASLEWRWITWDVNEAFGNFTMGLSQTQLTNLPLAFVGSPGNRPLYERSWADATLHSEYITELCDLVSLTDTVLFRQRADSLRNVIADAVHTDTHKFYSNAQFDQNVEQPVNDGTFTFPGVLAFLRARIDFVTNALLAEGCTVGMGATRPAEQLSVGPVPASDVLRVFGAAPGSTARLFDATARVLRSVAVRSEGIDVRELPPGTYVLEVSSASGGVQRVPVVVAR